MRGGGGEGGGGGKRGGGRGRGGAGGGRGTPNGDGATSGKGGRKRRGRAGEGAGGVIWEVASSYARSCSRASSETDAKSAFVSSIVLCVTCERPWTCIQKLEGS